MIKVANLAISGDFKLNERSRVYKNLTTNARWVFGRSKFVELWELVYCGNELVWRVTERLNCDEKLIMIGLELELHSGSWLENHDLNNPNQEIIHVKV